MTYRRDGHNGNRSSASRVAHVIERVGLALAGALCGLFVAALLARADVEMLGPVDLTLAMMLLGIIGFYLGIDMPTRRTNPSRAELDFAELFSAAGVFLATATALVSVCPAPTGGYKFSRSTFLTGEAWLKKVTSPMFTVRPALNVSFVRVSP